MLQCVSLCKTLISEAKAEAEAGKAAKLKVAK